MLFSALTGYLQQLETIASRLEMTRVLAAVFTELTKDEVRVACYLMQGRLVPAYESLEFNLSEKMLLKALSRIGDTEELVAVQSQYKKLGDLGLVAETLFKDKTQIPSYLTIIQVHQLLVHIAQENGVGSQERKILSVLQLIKQLDAVAAKFVIRIIVGKMRLGFSEMTMIDALSWAMTGSKSERNLLEDAYNKKADIGSLAEYYLAHRDKSSAEREQALTETYTVQVGIPVVPALCQRLNTAAEIVTKMGEVFAEPKYDGMRVQVHVKKPDQVKAYTRNLEDVSHMFPELIEGVKQLSCQSCILDSEAVGYNNATGELLAFQQTITRRRKHEVEAKALEIPMRFYTFDILELNGRSLIDETLSDRKNILAEIVADNSIFIPTPFIKTGDVAKLQNFHQQQLGAGLEGIVSKQVNSVYQSGRKGRQWVKTKEEEGTRGKLSDTIDVVVMGYYKGTGKRTEFEVGALLVGVLDTDQHLKTLSKVGSGLTEVNSMDLWRRMSKIVVMEKPSIYEVSKNLIPDVWVEPSLVIEVAADEITTSPIHTAGIALRFPRLMRVRDDKAWHQATTLAELQTMQG